MTRQKVYKSANILLGTNPKGIRGHDFMRAHYIILGISFLVLLILTPFSGAVDLFLADYIFKNTHFRGAFWEDLVYDYESPFGSVALYPGCIALLILLILALRSRWRVVLSKWRPAALAFALTLLIGPGLLVNTVLKDHWGRPRPKQLEQFGGNRAFVPYYQPCLNVDEVEEHYRSFPCGHASMGFLFFSLLLIGQRQKNRYLMFTGLILAIVLGGCIGLVRMLQGGHFFSDVVFSCFILYGVALLSDYLVYRKRGSTTPP